MSGRPRVAFAGTPDFAVPALRSLHASGAEIPWVLTQPDRPQGRGRRPLEPPIKREALELGLPVRQPGALPPAGDAWGSAPDLLVVVAFGVLLPEWLLAWPRCGSVNVHASLLPRWRGAAPIQHAILAGDSAAGVSVMRMVRRLDAGPVYLTEALEIGARETGGELHDRLAVLGAELLARSLGGILDGSLTAEPQEEALATYARKIAKEDALIDWRQTALELDRRVRAFNPWPVCETRLDDGRRLRVWEAEALPGPAGAAAGSIVAARAAGIDVATGEGVLRLSKVQPPSGRVMPAAAYLNAHPLAGARFV